MTKYFIDYYKAKDYAKDHNLVECEYGDTGIKMGDKDVSYVAYNKSGDRDDEWEVECYYTWENDTRPGRNGWVPAHYYNEDELKGLLRSVLGITELEDEDDD